MLNPYSLNSMLNPLKAPEIAVRLTPVCRALDIDKDDFNIMQITSSYEKLDTNTDTIGTFWVHMHMFMLQ
jgi:hypothetical protein